MKVTVTPEGVVTLEVTNGDGQVALDMIRALQAESKKPAAKPRAKSRKKTQSKKKDEVGIQPSLFDALSWMADNDSEDGVTAVDLAQQASISNGAAGQRIQKLLKAGYVYRVSTGHYRAVKPTE